MTERNGRKQSPEGKSKRCELLHVQQDPANGVAPRARQPRRIRRSRGFSEDCREQEMREWEHRYTFAWAFAGGKPSHTENRHILIHSHVWVQRMLSLSLSLTHIIHPSIYHLSFWIIRMRGVAQSNFFSLDWVRQGLSTFQSCVLRVGALHYKRW